jgi:rhomboid protease GluP
MINAKNRASRLKIPIRRVPVVIWVLAVASLLPELVLLGADLGLWGTHRWRSLAYQYAGFWAGLLGNWHPNYPAQPYVMFASYGFLHAGPVHFLVNAITLLSLGPPLAETLGPWRFLALYTVSLVGGAIGFAALSPAAAPMIGASGALFGLAGAFLAHEYNDRTTRQRSQWPIVQALIWLCLLNLALWWAMHGQLAWQTHLGGFIAGWAYLMFFGRQRV